MYISICLHKEHEHNSQSFSFEPNLDKSFSLRQPTAAFNGVKDSSDTSEVLVKGNNVASLSM